MTIRQGRSPEEENEELKILGTHAAGSTDLFQTRKAPEGSVVTPPPQPGGTGTGSAHINANESGDNTTG